MSDVMHASTACALPGLLRRRCHSWRDREALRFDGQSFRYSEILDAAATLACRLNELGLPKGDHVACMVERGPSALVAFLGILQSGGALLPLDSAAPSARLDEILGQTGARFAVVDPAQLERLRELGLAQNRVVTLQGIGDLSIEGLPAPCEPLSLDALAYTLFTSGTTGKPKGVQISHGALLSSVEMGTPAIRMGEGDRVAQLAPLAFDAAVWEHLAPLWAGATLVPIPASDLASPEGFIRRVEQERITWSYLPPALFAEWVRWIEQVGSSRARQALGSLKVLLFAGDVLPAPLVRRWQDLMGTGTTLMNFYGPTETTVLVCGHVLEGLWPADRDTIPMGRAFGSNRALVLDEGLLPCASGTTGTIFVGGPQLALGYLDRPAETASAFLPDPVHPGERLYDTKDLGYVNADGDLVFVGRRDRQVKIRGKRLELEDLEAHLRGLPGVAQAAALVVSRGEDKRLWAFVAGTDLDEQEVRHSVAERVPDYMVPHRIMALDALPVGGTGKIDRSALAALTAETAEAPVSGDPLAAVWAQVLGQQPRSEDESFLDAGGDSLLLLRALMLAQQAGYTCSNVSDLLKENTLAGWRRHLHLGIETEVSGPRPIVFPLAPIQREMFALRACYPDRQLYVIQFVFEAEDLDAGLLEQALRSVIRHHPMLRCVREGSQQRVLEPEVASTFVLAHAEVDDLEAWKAADHARAFDPSAFPLFRATWLKGDHGQRYLGLTFFHTVLDGWSLSHLVLQTCSAYRDLAAGRQPVLPERRSEFSDYVVRIQELAQAPELDRERRWWDARLGGALPLARLNHDGPGGPLKREAFWCTVPLRTSDQVRRRAAELGVTLHRVLLAAYFRLIHRATGQRELLLGNTVAGRPWELPDIDQVVGCTIDIQPVIVPDAGASLTELVRAVGQELDGLAEYTRLPGSYHLLRLRQQDVEQGLCWKVIFALDNFPESFRDQELRWPPLSWNPIEPFEVALSVVDLEGRLSCYWNYRADMVTEAHARRLAEDYLIALGDLDAA